jgi:hypothetical protein
MLLLKILKPSYQAFHKGLSICLFDVAVDKHAENQCGGSMTFGCGSGSGSGSADSFMPLTNGSGSGSCSFRRHYPSRCQQIKKIVKFFCLLLVEGTFTTFFKDKKSKRSYKAVGIKVFLLFLLGSRRIRSRIHISH